MARRQFDGSAKSGTLLGVALALLVAPPILRGQELELPRLRFQETPRLPEAQKVIPPVLLPPQPSLAPLPPPPLPEFLIPNAILRFAPAAKDALNGIDESIPFPIEPDPLRPQAPPFDYRPIENTIPGFAPAPIDASEPQEPGLVVKTSCNFDDAPNSAAPSLPARSLPPSLPLTPQVCAEEKQWFHCIPWLRWMSSTADRCANPCDSCMRFCDGVYECLCCPDPCYVPRWQPLADTAFDVASARPITQQRLTWNAGVNLNLPDRSEFFWARADGNGRGPAPVNGQLLASNNVKYNDLTYYFEAAIEQFSLIVSVPYRNIDPEGLRQASGVGDVHFGAKTLFFDCELLQVGGQFLVYAPTGDASQGLGTGHFSLEPSLLFGLRMGPETFLQGQLSEWVPVHGDPGYAGSVFHTHFALNHLLCQVHPNWPLIGTFGFNSWTFQDGSYTDPVLGANQRAAGYTYMTMGPGLRLFMCDRIDLGFSVNFALNEPHFAGTLYTTEFRWRF